MKLAVDVIIGKRGIRMLEKAGHDVVVVAEHAESDRSWFLRALGAGAEVVIAIDSDLEILCYGNDVPFIRAKYGLSGKANAQRAIAVLKHRRHRFVRPARQAQPP